MSAADASRTADIRVAVSTVIFALRRNPEAKRGFEIVMPVVKRIRDPHEGKWALPGGWLQEDHALADEAARTLQETTGVTPSHLEQLYAFGAVDRSPTRVVSIVYWALVRSGAINAELAPENVAWVPAEGISGLAFDHDEIVAYALWRLRNKVGYSRIAHGFLPERFTLAQLREVTEVILDRTLDPANFRRQVEVADDIVATGDYLTGAHRPARLYQTNGSLELADRGPLTSP